MPHKPVSRTSNTTHSKSPRSVNSNTEKLKMRTKVVWKHMTHHCVTTWEKRISTPVTPDTKHRSKIPSLRSINMAPLVRATDRKKMMLKAERKENFYLSRDMIRNSFAFFSRLLLLLPLPLQDKVKCGFIVVNFF